MNKFSLTLLVSLVLTAVLAQPTMAPNSYFEAVKWRSIGPFRGGRSVTATGVVGDPLTYYMGTTGGGLWKTEDAGQYWYNISDGFFATGSVGAVAVSASHPNVVYCGMGEHAVRGVMTSYGDGVYKSTNAGKTWQKIGLAGTQHISRIVIHPDDPNTVFVAAQGALYGPSKERGIYKSTDGGATWQQVLFVDQNTGCVELDMDKSNPSVLYAAMWEHGRKPWKVISGGPGSGLYKSTDTGKTWQKIEEGLPDALGKMAVAVAQSNPDKVYALIESDSEQELGGLFVSSDAGKNWTRISDDHRLIQRAWYYIEVFVDPRNENVVYVMSAEMLRSIDGGKTWEVMDGPHGDYHDLWINPDNPKNMVLADDGGAGITFNWGQTWSTQSNMPTAQIYRVNVDNRFPYRVYGGQQDNSSVVLASREPNSGGIDHRSWTYSAGGESAFLAFDPDDPRYVLGGSYLGTIEVLDTKAEAATNIMAAPIQYLALDASEMRYRFNWNAPIVWSAHQKNTYYHGAQYVLRTQDMGQTWEEISPDLTRNEKDKQGKGGGPYTNEAVGAENYGTISYLLESPQEAGVIWVGTDDGLVQLTRDGGKSWQNVTPAGMAECLVNAIEVSPFDPATVYIATTRYKFNDHAPGLYVTHDYGQTWAKINKGIPAGAYTRVVRADGQRRGLLLAGTETGLYLSLDDGANWQPFQLNLPVVPVTDMAIRHDDIIVATAGRGFWILDDLPLLRQKQAEPAAFQVYLPEDALLVNGSSELNSSAAKVDGTNPLRGVNPANGLVIYYQLPTTKDSSALVLEIRDARGRLIRSFISVKAEMEEWDGGPSTDPALAAKPGLNRIVWDLRHATRLGVPGVYIEGSYRGHKVAPGAYTLTLTQGSKTSSVVGQVLANPLYPTDDAGYQAYDKFMTAATAQLNEMHQLVNTLDTIRRQVKDLLSRPAARTAGKDLRQSGEALLKKLGDWDALLVQRKSKAYDDVENYRNGFTADYLFLINQTESDIPRVIQPVIDRLAELNATWAQHRAVARTLLDVEVPALNQQLWQAGMGAIRW
ncbi:MAG: glycosyl hydrolase [Bacteroidetes bacterium]|nr:MAG: glycosyl hydrolase [Bacteroidota bacterium]